MTSKLYHFIVLNDAWYMKALRGTFYFVLGMITLGVLWKLASVESNNEIPDPAQTWLVAKELLADPFYDYGPNDKGVILQLWMSIERVFTGFFFGSLVAIPLGMIMGANKTLMNILNPIVQILRPVSPLAWFPLGLLFYKSAATATVFIIFVTSLWPTLINTAFGVSTIPDDYKNVSKAFGFSVWKYTTKIIIPYALPHIITGLRLSVGVAWMVIVAAEMLSGGMGIGFFVWDSWNGLSLEKILTAMLIIGTVGVLLDRGFSVLHKTFAYDAK